MIEKVVFFVYDTTPRVDRRIESFIDAGFKVEVYGHRFVDSSVMYCKSEKYEYNIIADIPRHNSTMNRIIGLRAIKDIVKKYNKKTTLFYFFTLNVAALAPFWGIRYIYEESDMLFSRFRRRFVKGTIKLVNKLTIARSILTVMTSEGFADYYYGKKVPSNIVFLHNKVNRRCLNLPKCNKHPFDREHIKFAFVGNVRYNSLLNIARYIAKNFPQHEFHFYGDAERITSEVASSLDIYKNVFWHGPFANPNDFPTIYSQIDILICTYDVSEVNPRYAEPNKLYEAIFFETPIVVSPNSYLEKKVKNLHIGTSVDANSEEAVKELVESLNSTCVNRYIQNIKSIDKHSVIIDNSELFKRIQQL